MVNPELFNHPVRSGQHLGRDLETNRLRSLKVDDQLEPHRLPNGQGC